MEVGQWSFDNAFLYVGSVASTVGYGNVIPKTDDGRTLTIILAIIGIPIYAILLRKINSQVERWIFYFKEKKNDIFSRKSIIFFYVVFGILIFVVLPSIVFMFVEEWSFIDAFYFSITTISKIGFGDFVPSTSPPDRYGETIFNKKNCLKALINPSPRGARIAENGMPVLCQPTVWPKYIGTSRLQTLEMLTSLIFFRNYLHNIQSSDLLLDALWNRFYSDIRYGFNFNLNFSYKDIFL